jgi:rhodanese-related sulfurtransferase
MRTLVIILMLASFVAPSPCSTSVEGEKYSWISLREARDLYSKPGVFFIDVNEPEVYGRYHIPGATPVTDEHLQRFLPADRQATLVFYCAERRCTASHAAAREAAKLGYSRVLVMPEGIFGWVNAGLPVDKGATLKTGKNGK